MAKFKIKYHVVLSLIVFKVTAGEGVLQPLKNSTGSRNGTKK
jgi:hypothetical protein